MNKRQAKKEYRKALVQDIHIFCYGYTPECCEEQEKYLNCSDYCKLLAHRAFVKILKKEGFSTSGWEFAENPAKGVYIFYNHKKHKEITLETGNHKSFDITVYDFHSSTNVEYPSIVEALKSPYHTFFYAPELWRSGFTMQKRKEARERYYEGDTKG